MVHLVPSLKLEVLVFLRFKYAHYVNNLVASPSY